MDTDATNTEVAAEQVSAYRSPLLPADAAEHLAAYQVARGSKDQMAALVEIIRMSALFADILRMNGRPMGDMFGLVSAAHAVRSSGAFPNV